MHATRSSRRHTSSPFARACARTLVAALSIALVVTAVVPTITSAQGSGQATDLRREWQVLTYRAENGQQKPVLPGVGASLVPFAGQALGSAACSTYEASYSTPGGANLFFSAIRPERVDCDAASQEFDEDFYRYLADTASFSVDGSILRLYDNIGSPLMVLTSAQIDDDPTVARWNLARIAAADGSVERSISGLNPWIEFLPGGSLVGRSECGSFLGSYTTFSGTMDITDVRYRLRDCNEAALDQAERTIATLAEIENFDVQPTRLALQDGDRTTRLALTPDIELNSRTWTPTAIFDRTGKPTFQGGALETSAVQFDGPAAEGITICWPFTAESLRSGLALVVDPGSITFDRPKGKDKSCPNNPNLDQNAIHRAFMGALRSAASHALRGSELELKDVDGRTLMTLEPQAELIGPTWVVTRLGKSKLRNPVGDVPLTATFDDPEITSLVSGDTGPVAANGDRNDYLAFFTLPNAARIDIENIDPRSVGPACFKGKKRVKSPVCNQELTFLQLLSEVDTYNVKPDVLYLQIGSRRVMQLKPAHLLDLGDAR